MPEDRAPEGGSGGAPLFPDRAPSGAAYLFPGAPARPRRRVEPAAPRVDRGPGPVTGGPPAGPPPPPVAGCAADPVPAARAAARRPRLGRPPWTLRRPRLGRPSRTRRRLATGPTTSALRRLRGLLWPGRPHRSTAGPVPAGAALVEVVGVVDGEVRVAQVAHRYRVVPVLFGATALAGAAIAVVAVTAGLSATELIQALPGPVLAAGLAAATGRVRPATRFPGTVPTRHLQLRALAGGAYHCLLVGEPRGGAIRSGSIVRITAGPARGGRHLVRWIDLLATTTGPVTGRIIGRMAPAAVAVRWADRVGQLLAALTVVWTLFVLGGALR